MRSSPTSSSTSPTRSHGVAPAARRSRSIDWLLLLAFVAGARLLARTLIERPGAASLVARGKEVIVVGAGDAGAADRPRDAAAAAQLGYTPIGLVDDDPRKKNLRLHGVRVLGTTDELPHILRDNRAGRGADRDPVRVGRACASGSSTIAQAEGVPVKTLPGLYELISGDVNLAGQIRPVQVEDVLGREPVEVDLDAIAAVPRATRPCSSPAPAARSAPSSAARSRALGAARLVLVEQAESALFEIERELVDERGFSRRAAGARRLSATAPKMRQVFERYRPAVVFHAAAYKHVPLLEANPLEAVRNNALATRRSSPRSPSSSAPSASCSSRPTRRSNPKNRARPVEGALRVDRRGVRPPRATSTTRFVAVRFGNVLSNT